jgi:mRNA interferase RelE/StbE
MTYTVTYTARARRDLKRLPPRAAIWIIQAVAGLRNDPYAQVRKLVGFTRTPVYRLRVGEYRVVLVIEDERLLVLILGAGHRSTIYR